MIESTSALMLSAVTRSPSSCLSAPSIRMSGGEPALRCRSEPPSSAMVRSSAVRSIIVLLHRPIARSWLSLSEETQLGASAVHSANVQEAEGASEDRYRGLGRGLGGHDRPRGEAQHHHGLLEGREDEEDPPSPGERAEDRERDRMSPPLGEGSSGEG